MKFEILPTIDIMIDLYSKSGNFNRFQEYMGILQGGTKNDLAMPVSGFNPMAKTHLLEKINELKNLKAEEIIEIALTKWNADGLHKELNKTFKVAINVADDLKGGWTNRFTSDYDSKFRFSGVFNRNFCTPFFWTSENYTTDLVIQRTQEYALRTIYWLTNPKPKTLKAHLQQEIFVAIHANGKSNFKNEGIEELGLFYSSNEYTDNYNIIFNFFYGDNASALINFPLFGINSNNTGFEYAKYLASKTTNSG